MSTTDAPYQMRAANGEFELYQAQPESEFKKFNKEYLESLCNGYVEKIDALIEKINMSDVLDDKTKNKIAALMISLVLDNEDILELKKTSKIKSEISSIIPNMTEIQFINDIPFDIDIVERVFKYILKAIQGSNIVEGSQFGMINENNYKDFNDVFSIEVIGEASRKDVVQDISYFNKKNKLVRQRLIEFATNGKKIDKKDEIKIRREYKFDPKSQSFQKRPKAIAKKVYDLLAEKISKAYDSLYDTIK